MFKVVLVGFYNIFNYDILILYCGFFEGILIYLCGLFDMYIFVRKFFSYVSV